jgi:hypothetical protein
MQPVRRLRGLVFLLGFSFGEGRGERGIFYFWSIPNVFCNMFAIAPQFKIPNHASIWGREAYLGFYGGGGGGVASICSLGFQCVPQGCSQ